MNLVKLLIPLFLTALITIQTSFSQDTLRIKPKTDTSYKPVRFLTADHRHSYINPTNPDTVTRRRFLWYNLKNVDDLFNFLPGYYMKYKDVGQENELYFNQHYTSNTAVLRHGRPVNDMITGTADLNLFSRNEVAEVELTNGFGNFLGMYNLSNGINIIDRQIYQNRPYTEISFFQDRYENLYFDGNYHQNYFRNFNFNVGITKHSYDGKYPNSDFDKWLGRFNFNFAATEKVNFFLYSNYAKIQRGLNGGVNPDTVNLGSKEEVFNISKAIVENTDAYEKIERFDIDLGSVFTIGKISYSKIHLYVSNSFREFRDEENRPNPNGQFYQNNFHWINYGAKAQQVFNFKLKTVNLISRTEGEYNYVIRRFDFLPYPSIFQSGLDYDKYSFIQNVDAVYKGLILTGYVKGWTYDLKTGYLSSGIRGNYGYKFDSLRSINVFAFYDSRNDNVSGGVDLRSGDNRVTAEMYTYNDNTYYDLMNTYEVNVSGLNIMAKLRVFKFDLEGNFSANFNVVADSSRIPKNFGNIALSYHDMAFKNKLEYKIGLSSRFWTEYAANDWLDTNAVRIPQNGTLDFFVMGKIGRATFGLTFENILDRLIFNTPVYPFMDRGGLFNAISRFNITWNFLD